MTHVFDNARLRLGGLLAVCAAVCSFALASAPDAQAFKPLKKGDRGPRVVFIQRTLHTSVDRVFGPATKRAVKRFQRRHGLHADGIVGPATWAALKRVGHADRTNRSGRTRVKTRGGLVKLLQQKLGVGADGVFGPNTKRAVKRYQRGRGLYPDGVVGPATWAALGAPKISVVLKRGRLRGGRGSSQGSGAVARVIAAANRIAATPYKWGGGHGQWQDSGYDCSGSVSYALHGGGLLSRSKDSTGFMSYGAPGPGRHITIYAHGGHVFMVVNGRRFDTTGRGSSGSRWQPSMRSTAGYTVRHPVGY
jgi:cell wall-associated NlpC family hydrolase